MVQKDKSAGDSFAPGSASQTGIRVVQSTLRSHHGAFGDRAVVLVPQARHERVVRLTQAWDGPEHLRIGGDASDDALEHYARRLGIPARSLRRFREEVRHG